MRELIAGEGGSVLALAASRPNAVALSCEGLALATQVPSGLPVYPVDDLPGELKVDRVVAVDCEAVTRDQLAGWASKHGVALEKARLPRMAKPEGTRVVAVSSCGTGSGKTALTRRLVRTLKRSGAGVAVARHPIANLLHWNRFDVVVTRSPAELVANRPIEEREELAPVVGTGVAVAGGLDPERTLSAAAREAGQRGVVVWDGGGAAEPWVEPDLHLLVVDLLRPGTLDEARLEAVDAVVMTKADTAPESAARQIESAVQRVNPEAAVVLADLTVGVSRGESLADRQVVLVEDWSSLVLGGLSAGAASVVARRFRCSVTDPRPFAVGAVERALTGHPHIGAVIPSVGRTPQEIEDLAASVSATPGEVVIWASNADPAAVLDEEERPVIRAFGELQEVAGPSLNDLLGPFFPGARR
jgi:predicted GTPase